MRLRLWHLLALAAWAAAAYGMLSVAKVPGDYGHELCGPWGCLPPLQALAALHGFWVVVLVPPLFWAIRRGSFRTVGLLGIVLLAAGALALALIVLREALIWLPSVPAEQRHYLPQRIAVAVGTLTDFPVVQLIVAGAVFCFANLWGRPKVQAAQPVVSG